MIDQIINNDLLYAVERGFKIKGWVPCPRSVEGKINPQVTKMYLGGDRFLAVFHVKPVYYETFDGKWRPLSEVCTHHGNRTIVLNYEKLELISPNFLNWLIKRQALMPNGTLSVTSPLNNQPVRLTDKLDIPNSAVMSFALDHDFYPDPDPETNTTDGYLGEVISTGHPNWDAIHDDTDCSETISTELQVYLNYFASGHRIRKGVSYFNTGGTIGASDTINSAIYSLYGFEKAYTAAPSAQNYITVVQVQGDSITSDLALTGTDFPYVGDAVDNPTEGTDTNITVSAGSWDVTGYNDFTLNAAGLAWIARSGEALPTGATNGITYLGIRGGHDAEDIAPTTGATYVRIYSAEEAGETTDPKLAVNYTEGGVTAGYKNLLILGAG